MHNQEKRQEILLIKMVAFCEEQELGINLAVAHLNLQAQMYYGGPR
jgi:hypothetical protein